MTTPIVITAVTAVIIIEVLTTLLILGAVLIACAALTEVHRTPRGGGGSRWHRH